MLSLFAVLGNNFRIYSGNADNRIIFADDDRGYCSRDVLRIILFFYARLSCISKVRFVIPATDNSLALFAMITASWLHGLEPVLPNTLQPEGFAVLVVYSIAATCNLIAYIQYRLYSCVVTMSLATFATYCTGFQKGFLAFFHTVTDMLNLATVN